MLAGVSSFGAATIYNESVSGDLSNSGLSPTLISVTSGSNQVLGVTGRGATAIDRDYFTVTVPAGFGLFGISVLPGTVAGGAVSFFGMQAGNRSLACRRAID